MLNDTNKLLKSLEKSNKTYRKVRWIRYLILHKYKPIILHTENLKIISQKGIIVAPNHQSTLDPIIITSIINKNIHWAALKRFFDAKDSIFNNNKNPIFCRITSTLFKKLLYFPIERKCDNPRANNMQAIKNMIKCLKRKQYIGIFPEGTTNKTNDDFGTFDAGFIHIAQKSDAIILPITLLWINEKKIPNKVIINIGAPLEVDVLSTDKVYEKYINIQKQQMKENKQKIVEMKNPL